MGNVASCAARIILFVVVSPHATTAVGTFDSTVSTGALTLDDKFVGAAAVGNKVVFAPAKADVVGVYDVSTGTFDASVSTGTLTLDKKFFGAAAVGNTVVFASYKADVVGVYDVSTGTFDASVSTGVLTLDGKFTGAAAVSNKVVFAPRKADVVGIFTAAIQACGSGTTLNEATLTCEIECSSDRRMLSKLPTLKASPSPEQGEAIPCACDLEAAELTESAAVEFLVKRVSTDPEFAARIADQLFGQPALA